MVIGMFLIGAGLCGLMQAGAGAIRERAAAIRVRALAGAQTRRRLEGITALAGPLGEPGPAVAQSLG
jgi:hypothetical protein